jgi:hypothetical protein
MCALAPYFLLVVVDSLGMPCVAAVILLLGEATHGSQVELNDQ